MAAYSDPIPALADIEAEALAPLREGELARHASRACDAWGIPDGPLPQRLIGLAFRGRLRKRSLPQLAEGIEEWARFACDCHGIEADPVLAFRLGLLAGRAP